MRTAATRLARDLAVICLSVCVASVSACSEDVPDNSACRHLTYKETGLSRAEYLPCAGEMIAALDELGPQSQAALTGDRQSRSNGEATLRRLTSLMRVAGGRNLLERWRDGALTDLNVDIHNAVTKYQAFYMLPILEEPHPYAAKSREAAEAELQGATRRHEEARSLYRHLR